MRLLALAALSLSLASLTGCPQPVPDRPPEPQADPAFPQGYQGWQKINAQTIVREDEGIARELFASPTAEVLVKEQYVLAGGEVGPMQKIAVMRKTGDTPHNGWTFLSFDPQTKTQLTDDTTACVGCHGLADGEDFVFSDL